MQGLYAIVMTIVFLLIPKMRKTGSSYDSCFDNGFITLQCNIKKSGGKDIDLMM